MAPFRALIAHPLPLTVALSLAASSCGTKYYLEAMEADDVEWVKEHQSEPPKFDDFESAIRWNAMDVFRHYLSQTKNPDQIVSITGQPLLHAAIHRPEMLKLLVAAGCNPNRTTPVDEDNSETGRTPLIELAARQLERIDDNPERKNWEAAKILLDAGADPNARDAAGHSALEFSWKPETKAVKALLLSRGALTVKELFEKRDKFLFAAIAAGDVAKARAAVDAGASVHRDYPLFEAVLANQPEIVSLLIERGALPNRTRGYSSALDITDEMVAPAADIERMQALIIEKGGRRRRAAGEEAAVASREAEERRKAREIHDAQVTQWLKARAEADQAALEQARARAYASEEEKAAEIAKRNALIDSFNRGTGQTVYQRYDEQGNLQWYRKEE
jgi:hypothetical protein